MNIEFYRSEINKIDLQLLKLLNKRARLAQKIGAMKQAQGLPIFAPEREHHILTRLSQSNRGPLNTIGIQSIFEKIIEACRQLE